MTAMRVMTWNVLWRFAPDWRARQDAMLSVLHDLQPDVIGLQECWGVSGQSQADVIAQELGMHSAFRSPSLPPIPVPVETDDQAGVDMGIGLVSRWPIGRIETHQLPVSHRQVAPVAVHARIERPDGPFDVIVAATEWEPDFSDDHTAQTTFLAELLAADSAVPRLLLADLNCDATQAEFAPFTDRAQDTWDLAGGDPRAVTLSSLVPFAPLEAVKEIDRRIDHILIAGAPDARFENTFVVDSPVDGLFPSDHFPVVLDLHLD
jgi:endonuclease/exonuclease/phosphatase family metal-dependent hydrolase